MLNRWRSSCFLLVVLVGVAALSRQTIAQQTPQTAKASTAALPAEGTAAAWGTVDGVTIEGVVEGPSTEAAPLQVACVFEYTEGDIFKSPPALPAAANGMLHLDAALGGIVTAIRKSGQFKGHALETVLLTPPAGAIAAKRVLLIGLGDRRAFTPDQMIAVGAVAMREALRLGVTHYAFASDLKDAGVDSPTALVAGNVVRGAFEAYRTERYLKSKRVADYTPVTKITLLAGAPFFAVAAEGVKAAVVSLGQSGQSAR